MLAFHMDFCIIWKNGQNESCRLLEDLTMNIKFMNFGQMVNEICLLEIGSLIISVLETENGKLFCDLNREKSRRNLEKFSK